MKSFFILFFLCFIFNNLNLSEAISHHNHKLSSAVLVGTVFCDTCFQENFSKNSHFISGASVSVECRDKNSRLDFLKEVKTNENGEFKVHLPFSVSKHVKKIKKCSVKLLSSSEPFCAVASTATSYSLHLKSRKQGIHIFSAGFFSFKPQKQPNLCNQKPRIQNSKKITIPSFSPIGNNPNFPPPLQDPTNLNLPPNPLIPILPPLPQLPPLPALPSLPPLPPLPGTTTTTTAANILSSEQESNPDFFLPPPILPPNPLQPSPLIPPLLPPNPLQPPPSPIIPLPQIPGLTPSPPPPVIPVPSIPSLPPLPRFPPLPPIIPGIPPASSSTSQKTSP